MFWFISSRTLLTNALISCFQYWACFNILSMMIKITILVTSDSDFKEYLRWYSFIVSFALIKLNAVYQIKLSEWSVQITLYCKRSLLCRLFRISFNSHSFSSFAMIIDDEIISCSDKILYAVDFNKNVWNVKWILLTEKNSIHRRLTWLF